MNEIVPRTPERGTVYDDENWYVPETPQSAASPQTSNGIPIPSLTRIRRSLGVLDSSPPPERTPSLRQCCAEHQKKAARFDDCSQDSVRFFKRARVSLFRDKRGEEGAEQHVRGAFSVNTKSFYGAGGGEEEKPALEDKKYLCDSSVGVEGKPIISVESFYGKVSVKEEKPIIDAKTFYGCVGVKDEKPFIDVKPAIKHTVRRKQVSPPYLNASKQQSMKRRSGEINRGVGHGIKKPRPSRKSPSNATISENTNISPMQGDKVTKKEVNKRLEEKGDDYEEVKVYDPSKKFFKCKYVTRRKAQEINALEDVKKNSIPTNEELSANDDVDCEAIARSPDLKTKRYVSIVNDNIEKENVNQTCLIKAVECSTKYPIVNLGMPMKSHGKHVLNMSINKFNLDDISENENKFSHCFSNCDSSSSRRSLFENNKGASVKTEKSPRTQQNVTADGLLDSSTEDAESDTSTKKSEKVANKNRYLTNFKEDQFSALQHTDCQQYNLKSEFVSGGNKDIHEMPRPSKKSSNNSMKSENTNILPIQGDKVTKNEVNKRLEERGDDYKEFKVYNPSKKFFNCKYVTRRKAKVINALEDIEKNLNTTTELSGNDDVDCEAITGSPDLKTKRYVSVYNNNKKEHVNQKCLIKAVECSTKYPIVNLGMRMKSRGKHILNMSINRFNNFSHYSSNCNTTNTKMSLFETNNSDIVEIEKSPCAQQNTADVLLDSSTEDAKSDTSTKQSEKVANKNQYLTNFKEDQFSALECKDCQQYNLIYEFSSEGNKDIHEKYHNSFQNLKYEEWKNQRIIFEDTETRIKVILIKSEDYITYKPKLSQILNLVAEEINIDGCDNLINNKSNKVYFLMKHNIIVSILVAGITIIQDHILSKPKIMFGVSLIWTAKTFRRQKIASQLVDVMRSNFDDDYRIEINRIAFSKKFLTLDGKSFAASYTKSTVLKVY